MNTNRRAFLTSAALGAIAYRTARADDFDYTPLNEVRVGFVGTGHRGRAILRQLLRQEGCRVAAICDIDAGAAADAAGMVTAAGQPKPSFYTKGPTDYKRLSGSDEVDLIVTATPWELHAPICVAAMEGGKQAATETPASRTIDDCWRLVNASEKSRKHCILIENYCYFREVMCVLNMVRQGVFGEPMAAYTGYQKESLYYNFKPTGELTFSGEGAQDRVGSTYPTHFIGPTAKWLDINRGDALDYLVSMGTFARAYKAYAAHHFGKDHPLATREYDMADMNCTLIRTKKGLVIDLVHDTKSPRPYRHYFRLQATNGIYEHIEKRLYILGRSPGPMTTPGQGHTKRTWEPISKYYPEFEHPLWRDLGEQALSSGHNGGDFMSAYRLIDCLRKGRHPDIDVYDAACWSSIIEISEESARNRSKPVDLPDFTRGRWKTRQPLPIVGA